MIIIGIDPHKTSHTAVAVDQREQPIGQLTVLAGPQASARLLAWAGRWPERRWAVESARGLGYHLAQQLVGPVSRSATSIPSWPPGCGCWTGAMDARPTRSTPARSRWSPCAPHPEPGRCGR